MTRFGVLSVLLINVSCLIGFSRGLKCLQCIDAASVADCSKTVDCMAHEQCFLEKVTTSSLNVVYNAGCRSDQVCKMMSALSVGKRSDDLNHQKRELVNCAMCCNSNPVNNVACNANLCGLGLVPTSSPAMNVCVACSALHASVNSCTGTAVCQDTEVCYTGIVVLGSAIRYQFGCEKRNICAAMIKNSPPVGRRQAGVQICSACCEGNRCNAVDCFALQKNMTLQSIGVTPSG